MTHVAEPVRFVIETKARILPQNERYWYYTKKSLVKQFNVRVKRREDNKDLFDVVGIDKSEEVELNRSKLSLSLQLANLTGKFRETLNLLALHIWNQKFQMKIVCLRTHPLGPKL